MNFIELSKDDLVNIKSIDDQHKEIIEILNKLHASFMKQENEEMIGNLNKLIEEMEVHFENEESLMKQYNYPGYISHKLEHDRIYNKTLVSADSNKSGKSQLSIEDLNSLKRWFFNHLELNDKKCGEFLVSKGLN
jgi:hemerythrin